MNDKERILMTIIDRMYFTQSLCLNGSREAQFIDTNGSVYTHIGGYDDRPIQKGDLVLAITGSVSDFKIGWVHQVIDCSTAIIREIGTNRLCNYGNEQFRRIVGVDESLLLEGEQYLFQQKVKRAFSKGDEYFYRFGGVKFFDGNGVEIWIREAFGGLMKPSKPFSFQMKWNKRTSVKKILEAMRENGYGTREFEPINPEQNQERPHG